MNSYNHYAYGAVCQWLFERVAGFRPDPDDARLQAHHLRADDHPGAVAGHGAAMTRPPAASRRAGRVDGDTVTYDVAVPDGRERHAGARRLLHRHRRRRHAARAAGGKEQARSLLAPGRHTMTFRISRPAAELSTQRGSRPTARRAIRLTRED